MSFETAVKHLFRHLHEPPVLRSNPLVRQFFEDAPKDERAPADALALIHRLVREGAERCKQADLDAGKSKRAHRQQTIVSDHLLGGCPIEEVAVMLGISLKHCYRERADICRRVAQYIREYDDTPTSEFLPEFDDFGFHMSRAEQRAELGDVNAALCEYDRLFRSASSLPQKIEVLCKRATIMLLQCGNFREATNACATAQMLLDRMLPAEDTSFPSSSVESAQANVDTVKGKCAWVNEEYSRALLLENRAASRLEAIQSKAPDRVKEQYALNLVDLSALFVTTGDLPKAARYLAKAEAVLRYVRAPSQTLQIRLMFDSCRLREQLVMDSAYWQPARIRLEALTDLLGRARASGLLWYSIHAAITLTQYYKHIADDTRTFDSARLALSLAREHQSKHVLTETALILAYEIASMRQWNTLAPLLPSIEPIRPLSVEFEKIRRYVNAVAALRAGKLEQAWTLASAVDRDSAPGIKLRVCLLTASMADALQLQGDTRSLVAEGIADAEKFGYAPLLKDAYGVAAKITGSTRFARKAQEVARLFTA